MANKVKDKTVGDKSSARQSAEADKAGNKPATKATAPKAVATGKTAKQEKKPKAAAKKPNVLQRFVAYLKNVRLEIKRTSWPSRGEIWRMSLIVVGALVFFGITIFGLDTIMTWLVGQFSLAFSGYDAITADNQPLLDGLSGILDKLSAFPTK